jgi:hypothetical protein
MRRYVIAKSVPQKLDPYTEGEKNQPYQQTILQN